jgi:predicted transcriptional regulator
MNAAKAITGTRAKAKSNTRSRGSSGSSSTSGTISTNGEAQQVRTLTISVEPDVAKLDAASRGRTLRAIRSGYQGEFITYSTPQQLFAMFPPKRWILVEKLQEIGPSSLRGLARAVDRDVKRVHEDVAALLADGIVERDARKRLSIPFAKIHIEFNLFASRAA